MQKIVSFGVLVTALLLSGCARLSCAWARQDVEYYGACEANASCKLRAGQLATLTQSRAFLLYRCRGQE